MTGSVDIFEGSEERYRVRRLPAPQSDLGSPGQGKLQSDSAARVEFMDGCAPHQHSLPYPRPKLANCVQ